MRIQVRTESVLMDTDRTIEPNYIISIRHCFVFALVRSFRVEDALCFGDLASLERQFFTGLLALTA